MKNHHNRRHYGLIVLMIFMTSCLLVVCNASPCLATMEEHKEEIKPEFTRKGDAVIAKLIPRAKSSSVLIRFSASEGRLADVQGVDFEEAARPEIDHKDFKSALFRVNLRNLAKGADVRVSITSNFFTSSTEYWVFNETLDQPWMNSEAEHKEHPNLVQEIILTVKDGGKFDADGKADGMVSFIGGPKDSFWGYALGTLFIRFFGIFLVLSVLMFGMMFSGKIFQRMERKAAATADPFETKAADGKNHKAPEEIKIEGTDPMIAAAIGVGLRLHLSAGQPQRYYYLANPETSSWTQQGRERVMGVRYLPLNRMSRKSNS
jgi:Na+-transporting methylmalonyl-CoA/oxaloacetate decarboxylase gamma subunit